MGAGWCLLDEGGDLVDDVAGDQMRRVGRYQCRRTIEAIASLRMFRPHERFKPRKLVRVRDVEGVQVNTRAPCDVGES